MSETVISVEGLKKSYGAIEALRGVDLSVRRGGLVGILGPNGAGKTTLVETIEGLRTPTAGRVRVLGLDPATQPRAVKERIGVQLSSSVEKEFTLEGFAPEARPFSPHLTLARVKDPRSARDAAAFASANTSFDGGSFEVKELVFFQSVLGPSGAAHTPLSRVRLEGCVAPAGGHTWLVIREWRGCNRDQEGETGMKRRRDVSRTRSRVAANRAPCAFDSK